MYLKSREIVHARQHCRAFGARGVTTPLLPQGLAQQAETARTFPAKSEAPVPSGAGDLVQGDDVVAWIMLLWADESVRNPHPQTRGR